MHDCLFLFFFLSDDRQKTKRVEGLLGDVKSVENENVMIILGQSDDVTLGGDFEAAAAADFDVGTLELGEERAVALEYGHVEPIAVRVAHEHVTRVRDVDPVRKVGHVFTPDAPQKLTLLRVCA